MGSPETVKSGLEDVAREYGADEVMVVTITFDHGARRRSYELIAGAFELKHHDSGTSLLLALAVISPGRRLGARHNAGDVGVFSTRVGWFQHPRFVGPTRFLFLSFFLTRPLSGTFVLCGSGFLHADSLSAIFLTEEIQTDTAPRGTDAAPMNLRLDI